MSEKQDNDGRRFGEDLTRRDFLRWVGIAGATVGVGGVSGVLAGCSSTTTTTTAAAAGTTTTAAGAASTTTAAAGKTGREIKIGYVTPTTGALAGFAEADSFIIDGIKQAIGAGVAIGGTTYPINIIVKDSQSSPDRAATVAGDLITGDKIDLMVVGWTPETTNPVSDQCEANGVPCISTCTPWQPWFFGRKGDPAKGFEWTYHYFWGLEDIIAVFTAMWDTLSTNKVVGAIWPNDGDGNAWADPKTGFPPALTKAGYKVVDPGRYPDGTQDFSAQISQFKKAGCEIITGVPIPPDFTNFWKQSLQQGFKPKIASVGKALLFPSSVEALGATGDGMSTEVWWSPTHPFTSSLTGMTSKALADSWTAATKKEWTQPLGFAHSLFEMAVDTLKRTTNVDDPTSIRDAIKATKLNTIVGTVDFSKGPVPNVAKTPLVGGQWGKGTSFPYEMVVVSNTLAPEIPAPGKLRLIP
jgi:branched-chain amino acid transport system substrate-binding protein